MSITDIADPPVFLCDGDAARVAVWLCENRLWPVVHTIFPFILYLYIRDFKFSLLLVYLFETLEALFEVFGSGDIIDVGKETTGDHLIGDPGMGFLGILIGMVWVRIFDYKYHNMTPFYKGSELAWFYYFIQFITLALPTSFLYAFPNAIHGIVPIVYVFMIVWIPGFYYGFSVLDERYRHWIKGFDKEGETYLTTYRAMDKLKWAHYRRFHGFTTLLMVLYLGSFVYRWTSVFVMALIHNGVILIITSIYGLATGKLDLIHKK